MPQVSIAADAIENLMYCCAIEDDTAASTAAAVPSASSSVNTSEPEPSPPALSSRFQVIAPRRIFPREHDHIDLVWHGFQVGVIAENRRSHRQRLCRLVVNAVGPQILEVLACQDVTEKAF